jgi:predicted ATP-grasp superfamily ATP-dependent carboligase
MTAIHAASERTTAGDGSVDHSVPAVVLAPGYVGHGIARTLGRLGVHVYGVHGDGRSPAARSRYWRENLVWRTIGSAPEASLDALLALGRRLGSQPLLVPTDDGSCLFVADNAATLRESFRFPDQPAGLARTLSSKEGMYHACRAHGIPTPETVFPRTRDEVVAFARNADFPVMLKPIENRVEQRQRADMRMAVVEDAATLLRLYDQMETPDAPNLMLQEYIPGGPENIWMFNGYFDAASQCLYGRTGRKLRQYPAYTGVTSLGVCMTNEAVAEQTRAFMGAVGYRGILDIGYKHDARSGEYKLLDVNPRVGSTFRLFVDSAGMDVVRAMYLDLTGQRVTPGQPIEGRKWVVENFDPVSAVRYVRDGRLTPGEWLRSFRGVQEGSWFARDDMGPFAAMGWRSLETAFRRLTGGGRAT